MIQSRKADCVKLIKDSLLTAMADAELAVEYQLTKKYIRLKRHRCMKYLRSILGKNK